MVLIDSTETKTDVRSAIKWEFKDYIRKNDIDVRCNTYYNAKYTLFIITFYTDPKFTVYIKRRGEAIPITLVDSNLIEWPIKRFDFKSYDNMILNIKEASKAIKALLIKNKIIKE